jgi:predicted nucleotidyltransferase
MEKRQKETEKYINSLKIGEIYPKNRGGIEVLNKESEILNILAKEPWQGYSFSNIQRLSKKKSKSYLERVLKRFLSEKIIKKENVGNQSIYSIELSSQKARCYAGFTLEHESWNKRHVPYKEMRKAIDKIPTEDHIFMITGSYAKNQQKPTSDIDVIIIIDDAQKPTKVYSELRHLCELTIPTIHLYVFRNKEFAEMLTNKEPNYGKEAAKNNLVLSGGQTYLKLIEEAISHGFKNP